MKQVGDFITDLVIGSVPKIQHNGKILDLLRNGSVFVAGDQDRQDAGFPAFFDEQVDLPQTPFGLNIFF